MQKCKFLFDGLVKQVKTAVEIGSYFVWLWLFNVSNPGTAWSVSNREIYVVEENYS